MSAPQKIPPVSSATCSMPIADSVYRLVVTIQGLMRWPGKPAPPGCLPLYRRPRW